MNRGRRKTRVRDEARGQPIIGPVHANPLGQNHYGTSSDEDLLWLMGGTNRNLKQEKNVLGALGPPYLSPNLEIPPRQPLIYVKGFGEDELDGGHGTLLNQDKQPQFKR